MALLRCPKIQVDKAYSRASNMPTFSKKLMNITGMSEQWVIARIKQNGDWHMDEAVSDLFDRLSKRVTPVPTNLAKTFRSLNACQRAGEGRFIGCIQLLLAWFHNHFWKVEKVSCHIFSENYSPLKELVDTLRRNDITEEKWMTILQNLQEEDVEWRSPWMVPDEILYRCGDFDWVPLLGIWGVVGYAPLLVLRQYRSRKFMPPTHGFAANLMTTPEYDRWRGQRINDNIPTSDQENTQSMEEHLKVISYELENIKKDFDRKSLELEKRIKQLDEEKIQLGLDVDIQKLEAEKLRKGKNKAEDDLDSLKIGYKKIHNSAIKLKVGLSKIEELKGKIEELETTLENRELQNELLEVNNERWKKQFHQSQDQVRNKDYVMGEALTQVREVADHLQTLAV
ncbi:hypothetical protein PVK06_024905 [Gossypium arboreum]|uniref:DUF7745 domain-containing protein n=1 Tax=Gossypium arboreum TaxID=29729 RepID=A0ABR0PEZ3_GOSAR|nr:hypothetical protein PVK06_024905 [Gossypium arboreum]